MNVRNNGDDTLTGKDLPQARPRPAEAARKRDIEAVEGEAPVLEAGDTSGVVQSDPMTRAGRSAETTELDSLFGPEATADFRARWDVVQRSFVDDPQQAVRDGDVLVTQVIESLSRTFAEQRTGFEKNAKNSGSDQSTESLRLALRRYRAFFERLLAI